MYQSFNGRVLRPRQFVPVPGEWNAHRMIREDWAGRLRWRGVYQHPEIANLVERHTVLLNAGVMSGGDLRTSARVEALLIHADEFFAWWFMQMDPERMLPDSPVRPAPEAVLSSPPSWGTFIALLGSIHRARAWIEALEHRSVIAIEPAAVTWARAYGVSVSEIALTYGGGT